MSAIMTIIGLANSLASESKPFSAPKGIRDSTVSADGIDAAGDSSAKRSYMPR